MEKFKVIRFYVGSNVETKEVEKAKACVIVGRYFQNFRVLDSLSYSLSSLYRSIVIEVIYTNEFSDDYAKSVARELKYELEQQSVLLTISEANIEII